ncbi:MAG: lipoprotein N-acyltransferase Lnb domain-containing protein [Pseudobdellovibrionaceae bacterium]
MSNTRKSHSSAVILLILFATSFIAPAAFGQLDAHKIKYVSYMLASPQGTGRSSFGHSYLLFRTDEHIAPNDQAIEFVASVDSTEINYIRAMGIDPYDRQVHLQPFEVVKKEITILQNRDLEIFDLNLSDYQRSEIIAKINQLLKSGRMGQYSFLSSNCADAVSDILSSIGIRVSGLTAKIPTALADHLQEKGLVLKRSKVESVENARLTTVRKYSETLKSIQIPKYYRTLDKMFDSSNEIFQLFDLLLSNQYKTTSSNISEIEAFISSYWLSMSANMKRQFKNLWAFPVGSVRLNLKHTDRSFLDYDIRSTTVECTDIKCSLNIIFSKNDEAKDFMSSQFTINSFTVKGDKVYVGDRVIGARLGEKTLFSKSNTILFAATPVVTKYRVDETDIVDIGFIIDTNTSEAFKKKDIVWNKDVIWQTNTNSSYPMCYTILQLQKTISEQAIFAPNLTRLSSVDNANIMKALLAGQIIVVPGFSNIYDFSKAVDQNTFLREIYPLQEDKYNGLVSGMRQWLQMEALTPETMKAMSVLTHELNISVPVIFRKDNSARETIGHALLITDMKDEGDHYSLSGYDPNFTYSDNFGTLDKKTLIMTTKTYGDVNLSLDEINTENSLLNLQITRSQEMKDVLIRQAQYLKKYSFSANEIVRMQ